MMLKFIKNLIVLGVFVCAVLGGVFFWQISSPLSLPSEAINFHITPGSSMRTAAREIESAGAEINPWLLIILGKVLRVETSIKAG